MIASISIRWVLVTALALSGVSLSGATFSFYSTLRAGRPANADWEMGVGTNAAASQSTAQFRWDSSTNHWRGGDLPQNFRIGFNATTQTAYVTVWDAANIPRTAQLVNTGAALSPTAIWTFPAANFFVSAANTTQPSSINVESLSLAAGVQVISGALPTSLGASQPPVTTTPMTAPLVIDPSAAGGSWYIAGTIRFSGLISGGGSAQNSQLQYLIRAMGQDPAQTPEPATLTLSAAGLLLCGWRSAARIRRLQCG